MKLNLFISISLVILLLACASKDEASLKKTGKYYELSDLKVGVLFPERPSKNEYGTEKFQVVDYQCFPSAVYDKNFKYSFSIIKCDLSVLANNISQLDDTEKLELLVNAFNSYQKKNPNIKKLKTKSRSFKGYRAIVTKMVVYNQISDGEDYSISIMLPYKSIFIRLEVITDIKYRNNKMLNDYINSIKL
jgi:hypothetical protein